MNATIDTCDFLPATPTDGESEDWSELYALYVRFLETCHRELRRRGGGTRLMSAADRSFRPLPREHFEADYSALQAADPQRYARAVASLRRGPCFH